MLWFASAVSFFEMDSRPAVSYRLLRFSFPHVSLGLGFESTSKRQLLSGTDKLRSMESILNGNAMLELSANYICL